MPFFVGQSGEDGLSTLRIVAEVTIVREVLDHPDLEEHGGIYAISFVSHVAGEPWTYSDPEPLVGKDTIYATREEALRAAVKWTLGDIADLRVQVAEWKKLLQPQPSKRVMTRFRRRVKV